MSGRARDSSGRFTAGGGSGKAAWRKHGDWQKALNMCMDRRQVERFLGLMDQDMGKIAWNHAKRIKKSIKRGQPPDPSTGGYAPLHGFTIKQKGNRGAPLHNTGRLMRAIGKKRLARNRYFVGVRSNKRVRGGMSLSRIAEMQENGAYIKITAKMRRWMGAQGFYDEAAKPHSSRSSKRRPGHIYIPPRKFQTPFFTNERLFRPVIESMRRHAQKNWGKVVDG